MQLTELKLDINNIARFLGIVNFISAKRQDHQVNTLIKCSTLLQVDFLKITTVFNKPLIFTKISDNFTSPIQYLFLAVSPSTTHVPDIPPPLKPQHIIFQTCLM